MSLFVGNSFVKTSDVQGQYSMLDVYDTKDNENTNLGEVILKEDFDTCIDEIKDDVNAIIKELENDYDLATAIDDLKILAEKLY